jgi:hypothetical protein
MKFTLAMSSITIASALGSKFCNHSNPKQLHNRYSQELGFSALPMGLQSIDQLKDAKSLDYSKGLA